MIGAAMTGDDLKLLTESLDQLSEALVSQQRLADKLESIGIGQAEIKGTLIGFKDASQSSIEALFEERRRHEDRLTTIEASYVKREDCAVAHADNRQEHAEFGKGIGGLNVSVAKIVGIATAANAVVFVALQILLALITRKGG